MQAASRGASNAFHCGCILCSSLEARGCTAQRRGWSKICQAICRQIRHQVFITWSLSNILQVLAGALLCKPTAHARLPVRLNLRLAHPRLPPVDFEPDVSPRSAKSDADAQGVEAGLFLDEEAMVNALDFPISPEDLIAKAKVKSSSGARQPPILIRIAVSIIQPRGVSTLQVFLVAGVEDKGAGMGELMADGFRFVAPVVGPLSKGEFLKALAGFDILVSPAAAVVFTLCGKGPHCPSVASFPSLTTAWCARAGPLILSPSLAPLEASADVADPVSRCSKGYRTSRGRTITSGEALIRTTQSGREVPVLTTNF